MRILVVNTGSSSLKLRVLGPDDTLETEHNLESWSGETSDVAGQLADLGRIDAVGHRVVHGGTELREPVIVDDRVEALIEAQTTLAPLHQPRAVAAIRTVRELLPTTPSVACFDTAYHATLPDAAATYALPEQWRRRWGLRRFGFHGLSHAYAARRAAAMLRRPAESLRIVSCHLGAGASVCASAGGRSTDTTMGYTPLEGLVMATRCGSVDPGLIVWLAEHGGLPVTEISEGLRSDSGLAGLGGGSGDLRDVLARRTTDPRAELAFDVYVHRLAGEVARMTASLGGLDALVFTGAVGEHAALVRSAALDRLGFLGLAIDPGRNAAATGIDEDLTAPGAAAATLVIRAREDLEIARQVRGLLKP